MVICLNGYLFKWLFVLMVICFNGYLVGASKCYGKFKIESPKTFMDAKSVKLMNNYRVLAPPNEYTAFVEHRTSIYCYKKIF
jgi:hypothetical protein